MYWLKNRDQLPQTTLDEFEWLRARMNAFLDVEHNPDGSTKLGQWQTYPVAWRTASGGIGQPVVGNGRLDGKFTRIGNLVHVWIEVRIGSTTDVGNGAWLFTLPAPIWPPVPPTAPASTPVFIGSVYSTLGPGQALVGLGDAPLFIEDHDGNMFQHNSPGDWAEFDRMMLMATYEAAPARGSSTTFSSGGGTSGSGGGSGPHALVHVHTFGITIDGGGSAITTGTKGYFRVPWSGTITNWAILLDQSGSIAIDVWKDTYANYPPTDADSITNGDEPEVSGAITAQDTDLSSWTTVNVTAGDVIGFHVDSATTATRATLQLTLRE